MRFGGTIERRGTHQIKHILIFVTARNRQRYLNRNGYERNAHFFAGLPRSFEIILCLDFVLQANHEVVGVRITVVQSCDDGVDEIGSAKAHVNEADSRERVVVLAVKVATRGTW
jgi:hypothetical protein